MSDGGFNISGISGGEGGVNLEVGDVAVGGDVIKDNVGTVVTGDGSTVTSNVTQTTGVSAAELAELMATWKGEMNAKIDELPDYDDDEKEEIKEVVAKIEKEANKLAEAKEAAAPAKPEAAAPAKPEAAAPAKPEASAPAKPEAAAAPAKPEAAAPAKPEAAAPAKPEASVPAEAAAPAKEESKLKQLFEPKRLERLMNTLVTMAPDIFEVATTTLANPLSGLGLVAKKIGEKIKLEAASS